MTTAEDYANQVHVSAPPQRVFEILTDAAGFASWWAPATGSAAEGGDLHLTFDGFDGPLVLKVKQATRPSTVIWDVRSCGYLPHWMLVLLDGDCPVPAAPGLRDRLLARLRARRLDGDLAAGASPDATVALALRARRLVGMRQRRDLARTAQRLLAAANEPRVAGRLPVPVCRDRVRACTAELEELIRRLLAVGPVSPCGVARAMALFTDATGPLYHRTSPGDLRASIRAAADAISPVI